MVVYFAPLLCTDIEVEPFQMEYQIVGQVFQACPTDCQSQMFPYDSFLFLPVNLPLHSIDMLVAGRAFVLVICKNIISL